MKTSHRRALALAGTAALCASVVAGIAGSARADDAPFTNPVTGTTSTYTYVDGSLSWAEANAAAQDRDDPPSCDNHLAVITSQDEQDYVDAHVGSRPAAWLGAQRKESGGSFVWVTGEPFDYTDWADGEPNNYNDNEPYLQFAFYGDANQWNDIGAYTGGYILETECAAPTEGLQVAAVDPQRGPATGGNTVMIYGSGFTGATRVNFGGYRTTFTIDSDTQITATAPAAHGKVSATTGKTVNVRVLIKKQKSPVSPGDRYTYERVSASFGG